MKFKENKGMSLIVFTIILAVLLVIAVGAILYLLNTNQESNNITALEQTNTSKEEIQQNLVTEEKTNSTIEQEEQYTNNLIDAQNGKIAFLELVNNKELQTEKHNGYYTYIDPFENKYNIKEIKNVVSKKGLMGVDDWAALFEVTVTYIDNNNKSNKMDLAIILLQNHEVQIEGNYDDYTGSTSFVRAFGLDEVDDDVVQEENKINTSYLNVYGVGNDFKYLEDVAKLEWNLIEDTDTKVLEYDLNSDEKKDTITTKYDVDAEERSYLVINNKAFKIGYYPISNIYIVDLDKNDETIEIVSLQEGDSGTYYCEIGIYSNDKYQEIKDLGIYGSSILVNENGKIIFECIGYCNPILTEEYYIYNNKAIKTEKPNLNNIETQEFIIEKEHVYYTKETPEKAWDKYSNSSKTMAECGIYKFEKDAKVKIIEYGTQPTSEVIKAKLEDGTIIYIMSEIFYTA